METQKLRKCDVLQRTAISRNGLSFLKEFVFDEMEYLLKCGSTVADAVNSVFSVHFSTWMDENGMHKLVFMVCGMLFSIKHGEVEKDLAYGTNWDIRDFETGNYDDLFSKNDLIMLKKDIAVVKEYLSKHPELLAD